MDLHPYVQVGRAYYAQALQYSGRVDEALRQYRMGYMMSTGFTWLRVLEAGCLAKSGRTGEAHAILDEVEEIRRTEYVDAYCMAIAYNGLGNRNRAVEELARARRENSINLCLLEVDPRMDALRTVTARR